MHKATQIAEANMEFNANSMYFTDSFFEFEKCSLVEWETLGDCITATLLLTTPPFEIRH